MGLILPQEVEVKTSNKTNGYYKNLGYKLPTHIGKSGKEVVIESATLKVHVLDLSLGSGARVKVQCDICGKTIGTPYSAYNKYVCNGKYNCHECIGKSEKEHYKLKQQYETLKPILIDELTNYINKNGYPSSIRNTFHSKNNMHSCRSYINCFGDNIINWIEACGFILDGEEKINMMRRGKPNNITKDDSIKIILDMSEKLNRPLMYSDFTSPNHTNNYLSVPTIEKYWKTLNKMKEELGLEITQENMNDKQLSEEETKNQIVSMCQYIKSQDKDFITTREIDKLSSTVSSDTLRRMVRKYFDLELGTYFAQFGVRMGNQGNGIVFNFDDKERTTSQFEFMFSKYLRDYGLKYNLDYFRDIEYKTFINNYDGKMNCDYVININGKKIYIEIAGIIENYKLWYYQNRSIDYSKSKDKYRLKLKEKEQMLKDNNLIYFILFPCDLTRDIFMQIINYGSLELKHNIEMFMKNNIDWVKIQGVGELKYKENETSCYGQSIVDYQEVS